MRRRGLKPRRVGAGLALLIFGLLVGTAQGSDVSTQAVGHISNGSGNVESDIQVLDFEGTLETRFRVDPIVPGTREVIAVAVAICDGGTLGSTRANVLVPVAGAAPMIAGGLGSIPCVPSAGPDGLATGFNGGVVTFEGALAQYMGTVRIYADTDFDGRLFEPGELVTQGVPNWNAGTAEAIVAFGRQGQMLSNSSGTLVADFSGAMPGFPLVLIVTVDVDNNAPSGTVDAALGLGVGDDTAQGGAGICASSPLGVNCGSNLMGGGPARDSFQVVAQGNGGPPGGGSSIAQELGPYDQNGNDRLEDGEFVNTIDDWVDRQLSDNAFFAAIDLWINQSPISSASVDRPRVQTERTSQGVRFSAPEATRLSLEVFNLGGRSIFRDSTTGATLSWNLMTDDGAPVANGVYLYRTTMTTSDGETVRGDVRKLVVRR